MSEKISSVDLQNLQENIYKRIHELEMKLNQKTNEIIYSNDKSFISIEASLHSHDARINDLTEAMSSSKNQTNKIPEMSKTIGLIGEDIFSHNVKLMNLQKEITLTIAKYDKIYIDNLILPGIIGSGCKFQNIKEYIDVRKILMSNFSYRIILVP